VGKFLKQIQLGYLKVSHSMGRFLKPITMEYLKFAGRLLKHIQMEYLKFAHLHGQAPETYSNGVS
jgi:hypothetical protein